MKKISVFASILFLLCAKVFALPQGQTIVSGSASFDAHGSELTIQQQSQLLHLQYESFDIDAGESVSFQQPNAQSIAINQVLNSDPTQIAGSLSANGQLYVLAPGGLIIHQGATIEASSFLGASMGIDNISLDEIKLSGSELTSGIVNNGTIAIKDGGYLQLISPSIINNGSIKNTGGDVDLAVAQSALVRFSGDMFAIELEDAALNGVITNNGQISAEGGDVKLHALVRDQVNELVINNQGNISASSVWEEGGEIYIGSNEGDIENHGVIESLAQTNLNQSTHIQIESDRIANFNQIKNNALGNADAGSIELNADSMVVLMPDSHISANADLQGDGGNIKVFSPASAIFRQGANISAEAGFQLGDGGFVDVSGWQYIEINGRVSTLALNGSNGEFLIDPYNVTISAGATNNNGFATNTYTPNGSGATINVTELQNNLKNGNVTVVTTGAGAESGDISVSVGIDLDGTNGNTLELIADGSIILNGSIADGTPGTADATNITLQALTGSITPGVNTVQSGGGEINLKTSGNVTLGTGGNIDLSKFDTEGGSLLVESIAGTITLISDIDLNGLNGNSLNFKANGDLNLDFDILDTVTASSDSVNITLQSETGDVLLAAGKTVNSYNGNVSLLASNNLSIGTAGSIDLAQINSGSGDLSIESTAGSISIISNFDLDGMAGSILSLNADTDLNINFGIADSNTGTTDATSLSLTAGGNLTMANTSSLNSYGGVIGISSGGVLSLTNIDSDGGGIFLTGTSIIDAGDLGTGYDLIAGGGTISMNISNDIGGTSFTDAIEIADARLNLLINNINSNIFLDAGLSTADISIGDLDYNGGNGLNFNIRAINGADIIIDGNIDDSNTGTADSATFNIETSTLNGNVTINNGNTLRSRGGDITISSLANISLSQLWSDGGAITITADNIIDVGTNNADINASGGLVTLNASGNIGSTAFTSAIEINDSVLDINATGTNQNVYLLNNGAAGLIINNVDYNGTGTFNFNVRGGSTGDITVAGQITDSAAGSVDIATINLETTNASSNILLLDGATVRSYGGDITYNTLGDLGIVRTKTDGGNLTITANEVYDNGNTGPDIETLGGVANFNVAGDVGVLANGSLEMRDTIITGTVGASNATWDFRTYSGTTYLSLGDIDFNGAGGFNLVATDTNGAELRVVGSIVDSSPASIDIASFNLSTTMAGSHIVSIGDNKLHSYGGLISISSAGDIALPQVYSSGGAINLSAGGKIYDVFTGNDISTGGGILTINAVGDVGGSGTGQSSALEIFDSVLDMTINQNNKNVYFNVSNTDSYFNINNIDYNGGDGLVFDVRADNGSDLVVTGDVRDSNTASAESATIRLVTNSNTSDITINSGSSIRSGDAGIITLTSANDLYLTGVFGGAGGTTLTAANDIIDNGDITHDVQSTGAVFLDSGRHMADGDVLSVASTVLHLDLGSGNHNVGPIGDISLGNIEIDGANGAQLSVIGNADIDITGSITDANGADDSIDFILGTSTPGFLIFPDAGYTVPGSLTFWSGTAGIRDSTDERISITADSLISSGNNFLNNTGPVIFDLTVDDIDFRDDSGTISFEINNSKNLRLVDLDGDGEFLLGKDYKLNINGDLAVPSSFIRDVDDQLWIIADDIDDPDADNIITIRDSADAGSDFDLIIELTGANDVQINTEVSRFDGTVAAGGNLTINNAFSSTGLDLSSDLNLDGDFINGDGSIEIMTGGVLTLNDNGLNTVGNLSLTADDIMDSNTQISLSANQLLIEYLNPASSLYSLDLNVAALDVSVAGQDASLAVQNSQSLSLQDLNADGNSLIINDGYAWLDVAGDISLSDSISVTDSSVDGLERGWMYVEYEGSAQFGVNGGLQLTVDGSLETGSGNLLDVADSQLVVRQVGGGDNTNSMQFEDATINIVGGDAIFDITNSSGNPTGYGDITMTSGTNINVTTNVSDAIVSQMDYADLNLQGSLNVSEQRLVVFSGYEHTQIDTLDSDTIAEIDQVVADAVKDTVESSTQVVAEDIQEEVVKTIEASPNVNIALNEMFGACKKSNSEDNRCKMKDEISRFLSRLLIGGSMPKSN